MIDENLKEEFLGQVIDIFDDCLEKKSGKKVNIQGEDYNSIRDDLELMMKNWGVIEKEEEKELG